MQNDIAANVILCTHCGALCRVDEPHCGVCNSALHQRKEYSLHKTAIFTLISLIFYVPANVLPMMNVNTLGVVEASTIFDGIVYFFETGSYGIALVIFVASIFVPIFKILVLLVVLWIAYYQKTQYARLGIKYYRIIHFIGKWSMIDIFVVALMIVMVQFGNLSTISGGLAAPSFTMVVIMTILATHSFDTRLLWDKQKEEK